MSGYKDLCDNNLTDLIRESDYRAYTEIYHRYFDLAFIEAYKKTKDEDQAKDIVQDVFINIWNKRQALIVSNIAGYIVISVRNRVFSFFQHQDVRSNYIQSLSVFGTNYVADTDYALREKQFAAYVELAIQSLPKKMKIIFDMSRKEFLSHKEIAGKLNTTEHNVSKQITNALKILRGKLGDIVLILFP